MADQYISYSSKGGSGFPASSSNVANTLALRDANGSFSTGALFLTNAIAIGTPGSASSIITGDPHTKGLVIKGTTDPTGYTHLPNATFFASYTASVNADYSTGSPTGTAFGGAVITSSQLDLTTNTALVTYSATGNANFQQTGTIRLLYTPNYTGATGKRYDILYIYGSGGTSGANAIAIFHNTGDNSLRILVNDSAGVTQINIEDAGVFSATAGTPVELEFDFDFTTGATRYFINGTQAGSTVLTTLTRSADITTLKVGKDVAFGLDGPNSLINNLIIYNTVQHTSNYTAPTTYPTGTPQASNLQEWQDSSGTVLSAIDSSGQMTYAAASSANWSGNAPTTVKAALDRIAAALGPIA